MNNTRREEVPVNFSGVVALPGMLVFGERETIELPLDTNRLQRSA